MTNVRTLNKTFFLISLVKNVFRSFPPRKISKQKMIYSLVNANVTHLILSNWWRKKHVLFEKSLPLLNRVKTFGWRRLACSPATPPKPWWRKPSATCRSPSASTSEPLSWRLMSGPRSEFSGRVRHPDKLVA